MNSSLTSKAESDLLDIVNGFSALRNKEGREFFFKHITTTQLLQSEKEYRKAFEEAQKMGILSKEELLRDAKEDGSWTDDDNNFVSTIEWEIQSLEKVQKKASDPAQKAQIQQRIDEKKEQIRIKRVTRDKIISFCAEHLAEKSRLEFLIAKNCYKDEWCKKKYDLGDDDISVVSECVGRLTDKNHLLRIAFLPSFFELFMIYERQPHMVFGVDMPALSLTLYQKNLLVYAGVLANKLKYGGDEMTDDIRKDPLKLFEFDPDKKKPKASQGISDLREKQKRQGELKPEDWIS